jgi:hypothetical protein
MMIINKEYNAEILREILILIRGNGICLEAIIDKVIKLKPEEMGKTQRKIFQI